MLRLVRNKTAALVLQGVDEDPKVYNVLIDLRPAIVENMILHQDSIIIPAELQQPLSALLLLTKFVSSSNSVVLSLWGARTRLTRDAVADFCENPAYASARARVVHLRVGGARVFEPLVRRVRALFPALKRVTVFGIDSRCAFDVQILDLRNTAPDVLQYIVACSVCDELIIETSPDIPCVLKNPHARVVTLPGGLMQHVFSNMRTLSLHGGVSAVRIDARGCPLLEAVVLRDVASASYAAVLRDVPTLTWLPIYGQRDSKQPVNWMPLMPSGWRFWNIDPFESDTSAVAVRTPHLLPLLAVTAWTPRSRYNAIFNRIAAAFFLAIQRLDLPCDPAAVEYVLRAANACDYVHSDF
jgi:hypothetical protein